MTKNPIILLIKIALLSLSNAECIFIWLPGFQNDHNYCTFYFHQHLIFYKGLCSLLPLSPSFSLPNSCSSFAARGHHFLVDVFYGTSLLRLQWALHASILAMQCLYLPPECIPQECRTKPTSRNAVLSIPRKVSAYSWCSKH